VCVRRPVDEVGGAFGGRRLGRRRVRPLRADTELGEPPRGVLDLPLELRQSLPHTSKRGLCDGRVVDRPLGRTLREFPRDVVGRVLHRGPGSRRLGTVPLHLGLRGRSLCAEPPELGGICREEHIERLGSVTQARDLVVDLPQPRRAFPEVRIACLEGAQLLEGAIVHGAILAARGSAGDHGGVSSTRVSRHVRAPRAKVYEALVDADAVARWKVPAGMTCHVHAFEAHEGGAIRISLTYDAPTGAGKTTAQTDTYRGRFIELVPNEKVVEVDEFETVDPDLQGEMTITITLVDADGGTDVVGVHDGLPPGVSAADNELGWQSALARLAALVEAG